MLNKFVNIFLGVLLVGLPASANSTRTAAVVMQVIQCSAGVDEVPNARVAPVVDYPSKPTYRAAPASVRKISLGFYSLTTKLVPGNYFYDVGSAHCTNHGQIAVLANYLRAISLATHARCPERRSPTGEICGASVPNLLANALVGTLPVTPRALTLAWGSKYGRQVDFQNGAFYIERISPGKYTLRVELHGGLQSEIQLDLSSIGTSTVIRRDIDLETLRRNLGPILWDDGSTLKSKQQSP